MYRPNHKLLKLVASACPASYKVLFGRKYHLPLHRQDDYFSMDFDNWMSFERLYAWACGRSDLGDEVAQCTMTNLCASFHFGRPTLYLERELGEALLRTELPADLSSSDVNWLWPSFRVVLPKELIPIERPGIGVLYPTHLDICLSDHQNRHTCPKEIAREIDEFAFRHERWPMRFNLLEKGSWTYKEHETGWGFSSALNKADNPIIHQTIYGAMKPWGKIALRDCAAIAGDLSSPLKQDQTDRELLRRMELLALNILLFLSAVPAEGSVRSQASKIMRAASVRHLQPELAEARFVGGYGEKSDYPTSPRGLPTGRIVAAHWVCGAWRRVPHGPGRTLRRLTWIRPYATGDLRHDNSPAASKEAHT